MKFNLQENLKSSDIWNNVKEFWWNIEKEQINQKIHTVL